MRFIQSQNSCRSGQLSRKLEGRIDIQEYANGCRELTNALTLPTGGVSKTSGWERRGGFNESVVAPLQKSFTLSTGQTFTVTFLLLDTPSLALRVIVNDNTTISGSSFSETISVINAELTTDKPLIEQLSVASYEDYIFYTFKSGKRKQQVIEYNAIDDTWTSSHQEFLSSGRVEGYYELKAGWYHSAIIKPELPATVQITKSGNTLSLSDANYNITDYITNGGQKLYIIGKVTYSSLDSYIGYYYQVTAINPAGKTVTVVPQFSGIPTLPDGNYEEFYFPFEGIYGYPKNVTASEGRIIYGGFDKKGMSIVASASGNPFFMANKRILSISTNITLNAEFIGDISNQDPFIFTPTRGNKIEFLTASDYLIIGSDKGVIFMLGTDGGQLGPLSVGTKDAAPDKCSPIFAQVSDSTYFLNDTRTKLFQLKYSTVNGGLSVKELSLLSDEIYEDFRIQELTYNQELQTLIMRTDVDKLIALKVVQGSDVVAHSVINLPDSITGLTSVDYNPADDHVYIIANDNFYKTKLYSNLIADFLGSFAIVENTVDATDNFVRFPFNVTFGETGTYYIIRDGEVYKTGTATITFDPVPPNVQLGFDVGELTLEGDRIYFGTENLPKMTVCLMPIEAGQQFGTAQNSMKRVDTVVLRTYKSYSYKIKEYLSRYEEEKILFDTDAQEPFTGQSFVKLSSSPNQEQVICVTNDRPEPLTILSFTMRGQANDG